MRILLSAEPLKIVRASDDTAGLICMFAQFAPLVASNQIVKIKELL